MPRFQLYIAPDPRNISPLFPPPPQSCPRPPEFHIGATGTRRRSSSFPTDRKVAWPCSPPHLLPLALARILMPVPEFCLQYITVSNLAGEGSTTAASGLHRADDRGSPRDRRGHHRTRRDSPSLPVPSISPGDPWKRCPTSGSDSGRRSNILR